MKPSRLCVAAITMMIIGFSSFSVYFDIENEKKQEKNIMMVEQLLLPNTNDDTIEVTEEVREVVYEDMTLDELAEKLERSMYDDLSSHGYYFASYAIELGIDPYLALAIVSEETGCRWNCSYLVKTCHNIGGMKGSGCGSYSYFDSLDEGIKAFLDNLKINYYDYGLTTAEEINPKYAENPLWASNVNAYIERIRNA